MKVNFLFPGSGRRMSGGFLVLFQYANGLAARGHQITLTFTPFLSPSARTMKKFIANIKYLAGKINVISWAPKAIHLHENIEIKWIPKVGYNWLVNSDAIIVSFWHSAEWLQMCSNVNGKQYYLIQEYEYYMSASPETKRRMESNFQSGMYNMAISPAVIGMLKQCGANVDAYLPNGIDLKSFYLQQPINALTRTSIGFPARSESFKCTSDAIKALELIRKEKDIHVWSFGGKNSLSLPDWVEYHESPSNEKLCSLYNSSTIFVVPSLYEGWGLTGSEAMACGTALVATNNGGVQAYATHGKTALLSQPNHPELLARNILCLLNNQQLRLQIAKEGLLHIQKFTWDKAVSALELNLLHTKEN